MEKGLAGNRFGLDHVMIVEIFRNGVYARLSRPMSERDQVDPSLTWKINASQRYLL
jgi:hypothetical protein